MTWLVTAPCGRNLIANWSCHGCPAEATAMDNGESTRAAAAAHVAETGHQVIVIRGTSELLLPLAATAPAPKELTR